MSKRTIWAICLAAFVLIGALAACLYILAQELQTAKAARVAAEHEVGVLCAELAATEGENAALRAEVEELRAYNAEEDAKVALKAKLTTLPRMDKVTVSHYCCEKRAHICGTGNGITASGNPVQAGVSVAVDPKVIPLGSTVYVDYGDGVIHTYIAHDTGGAVTGNHIDVAVDTHENALRLGLRRATVWWEE